MADLIHMIHPNPMFVHNISSTDSPFAKCKINRDYLLTTRTANELNTYINFSPFTTFNDLYSPKYIDGKEVKDGQTMGTLGVRSIFNKSGAVVLGAGSTTTEDILNDSSDWRISHNVPLMDSRTTRKKIRKYSGCTVKDLVNASAEGVLGRETYDYSDFMYCKHLGKVSNNYMITLRRFPLPVDDFISSEGLGSTRIEKGIRSENSQSIGCMVTWLGTPGNDMSNILKYNFKLPFTEQDAQWENSEISGDNGGTFGGIASMFDPVYQKQYQAGYGANPALQKFFPKVPVVGKFLDANGPYNVTDYSNFQDRNKIYGPVDAIKSTFMRDNKGLQFNQEMTITFDYELRSYNGINTRQAFLDLLSNILNVTYSTGTFWGGGYRGGGAHQSNIFANMRIFKSNGGASQFLEDFTKDASDGWSTIQSNVQQQGGWISAIKNALNNIGGMLLGGMLNHFGRPHKQMINSLLSPAPVGFWHVTVGNPHHPIMSLGNMILTNTEIEHYGPLGLDDFPTGIKVTCTLTRGKPRDLRDIEKIYMKGNNRIYSSMGPKVFDMYKHSKEYQNENYKSPATGNNNMEIGPGMEQFVTLSDLKGMSGVLQKYFGHTDTYSIYVAACEQEMGAHKKIKKGAGGGNSSAAGTGGTNTGGSSMAPPA